ncbi:MAG TPA: chain length determinant protein tyrosine kinase EpsG, partial [Burkholderiales bacterium]|nr:chain length determinant protein tyrosine kinase EpsG [Burkholderiales bacterium]
MNELISPQERAEFEGGERTIGAILVGAGALTSRDVERILERQREQGGRFGDAGKALGLVEQRDIDFALSRQFDYPYLR